VNTRIRKIDRATDLITIEPVAGCKTITGKAIVYDRPQVREIAFPNQFSTYSADLADRMRRDGAQLELRGLDRWMGGGDCPANLVWAK
jgi:hypothetical protein